MRFTTMTWNVNESSNSGGRVDAQLEYIGEVGADVVMLQAVRWEKWLPTWLEGLEALGFGYVEHTRGWAETLRDAKIWPHEDMKHHKVVVTASRFPMRKTGIAETEAAYAQAGLVFPERVLRCTVELPGEPALPLDVWNTAIVNGSGMGEEKVRMLEWVFDEVTAPSRSARLLAGDFNSPKSEADGGAESFADSKPAYIRERWREAELGIHGGLEMHGVRDAFRLLHGPDLVDGAGRYRDGSYSHLISRRSKPARRRRLDHTFASGELEPMEAAYMTGVLERAGDNGQSWSLLSDHAPMVVAFELG